jgi:hypothetical protein
VQRGKEHKHRWLSGKHSAKVILDDGMLQNQGEELFMVLNET